MTALRKSVHKEIVCVVFGALLLALGASAEAQQPTRNYRVGILGTEAKERKERIAKYLHQLGYIEGTNLTYEVRGVGGEPEPRRERIYANFAAELVRLKVDVIVAGGAGAVRAAKKASATIPIVMGAVSDPIALGFVESLAHPGGSITGISNLSPELSGKRLELVKEVIPKATRVAVLANKADSLRTSIKATEDAARSLHIQPQLLEITAADQLESAFDAAKKQRADALVQIQSAFLIPYQRRIIDLSMKTRLPAMFNLQVYVEAGGLMSYGLDRADMSRQIAAIVDKILKGRKPADIPVEQPKRFEFANALIQIQAASLAPYQHRIIDLAARNRLPAMFNNQVYVEAGGLMSYGPDRADMDRQLALMVDKILKGRKPADIPVEQPKRFEFAINLKTAKQIGLTIPPNVLARADKVIK